MGNAKRKRGRPKKEGSRIVQSHTLYSKAEYEILRETSKTTGKTISDLIRVGSLRYAMEEAAKHNKPDIKVVNKDEGDYYIEDFYDEVGDDNGGFDV